MFDCNRCNSTGRIKQQYYVPATMDYDVTECKPVGPMVTEVKTRLVECPACLGFSAVPMREKE